MTNHNNRDRKQTIVDRQLCNPNANFENRTLFQGDNIDYLRALNSESVDVIATDPPFNKNKKFQATPDAIAKDASFDDRWSFKRDVHQGWLDDLRNAGKDTNLVNIIECVRDNNTEGMGAFLCYMAVRLLEMRRVLKSTGSIFLHCDHTASHYLKIIMDAIFGRDNFRNEIIWDYDGPGGAPSKFFRRKHDVILFYAKGSDSTFNVLYDDASKRQLQLIEMGYQRASMGGVKQVRIYNPNHPKVVKNLENWKREEGLKIYYQDVKGKPFDSVWQMPIIGPTSKERRGYPTQKPIALYDRIIRASSKEGDTILDPFCGCATTLIAAEKTDRQWVGMDLWKGAYQQVEEGLKREGDLIGSDGTRLDWKLFDAIGKIVRITDVSQIENPYKGEPAAPYQKSIKRHHTEKEPWQKLSYKDMVTELAENEQKGEKPNQSVCAGCGRELETAWMHLDHISPKSDGGVNDLSNRLLLCPRCNHVKKDGRTIIGLWKANINSGWMFDHNKAKYIRDMARDCAKRVKIKLGN